MVRVLGFYHPMRGETVLLKTRCFIFCANGTLQNFGVNFKADVTPEGPFAHSNHWHVQNLATLRFCCTGGSGRCAGLSFAFGSFFTRYSRMCRTAISVLPFSTAICAFARLVLSDNSSGCMCSCYHAGRIEVRPYDRK